MCAGGKLRVVCANKNNFVVVVMLGSICKNSICCSSFMIERGLIIDVINPLLSFANASFLNPSASKENVPKLEFEFVMDASAHLSFQSVRGIQSQTLILSVQQHHLIL